ncbi:MAG: zinc D-Ala-D-Ala carboxypeptidase [Actinomycetota bacterium]|nr:zinc D-Ala-D-Ala carboxypeptidase [Actinomycetota bacterium]
MTGSQRGIVGALGLATIAAPLSGVLPGVVPPEVRSAALPSMALRGALAETSSDTTGPTGSSAVPVRALGARDSAETLLVSRGTSRSVLPGCEGTIPVRKVSNGRLPSANLCTLWDGENRLRADSAIALARLNIAYNRRFGRDLELVDSYRTLAEQRSVKASRGDFAARPGTSEHGWGLAVDLGDGVASATSDTYRWLRRNAGAYGWENPAWARSGGSGPHEPWHWEYTPGRSEGTGA